MAQKNLLLGDEAVALGALHAGKRALVCLKHVGLNVCADPFMGSAATGSKQCGIRVCVSRLLNDWDFQRLDRHLKQFVKLVS